MAQNHIFALDPRGVAMQWFTSFRPFPRHLLLPLHLWKGSSLGCVRQTSVHHIALAIAVSVLLSLWEGKWWV